MGKERSDAPGGEGYAEGERTNLGAEIAVDFACQGLQGGTEIVKRPMIS